MIMDLDEKSRKMQLVINAKLKGGNAMKKP